MIEWQPIETAPNDECILIAYDDKSMKLIQVEDNDYTWQPYRGERIRGIITPTHWRYPPEGPK